VPRETSRPSPGPGWHLLIHQLPPRPLYVRARIRQRLEHAGAVALKNSVYVLPRRKGCLEEFRSIADEARVRGGEAYLCDADFDDPAVEKRLVAEFRAARQADYESLELALGQGASSASETGSDGVRLARARRTFERVRAIDYFEAPGRERVERLIASRNAVLRKGAPARERDRAEWKGRIWATRRGLHIDRIASAWFIRRFLDARARFRFIDPKEPPRPGELRFDMPAADFTHEGDRCTFETLILRTGAGGHDRALAEIAEIVHDVDLKDGKFRRPEAPGLERLVTGMILSHPADPDRLERGLAMFDELYGSFRSERSGLARKFRP
jgi:hypothetical protein